MPHSDSGERVAPVLEFPLPDGLAVQPIRVDYGSAGLTRGTHRHPAGAYLYVVGRRRVFVAGASGLIGVRRVSPLVGAGYDVAGLTRTPARVARLPFVTDCLDSEAA
jgi:hypothetical protein